MTEPVLGILTLYLNDSGALEERSIYQKMTITGRKLGLHVFVFTPKDVDYKRNMIRGLFYNTDQKSWSRKWTAFPNLIYDRCRIQRSYRFEQLKRFRSVYGHLTFLNRPLRHKWTIHQILTKESRFKSHLPATVFVESYQNVTDMLSKYPVVFLKPISGTGGRGILRIAKHSNGLYHIQGRDRSRRIIQPKLLTAAALKRYLTAWNLHDNRYLAQQGIQIKLSSGRVHDYRMLVQKNGEGAWQLTGCAGRIGAANSVTSNLHGGGHAATMEKLLGEWLQDKSEAERVMEEASRLGVGIAAHLEKTCNSLCELALDLAIDRKGGIWLLEVNPKPAREVFARAGEKEVYRTAIRRPLEYALWMYNQKKNKKNKSNASAGIGKPSEDDKSLGTKDEEASKNS